jgi:hypothetical protein
MGSLWNRSGTIERYADDLRAGGAKAYFYVGNTLTNLAVYSDADESSAHPQPVVADANGRWPAVFVPYTTSYDVRVLTAENVQLDYIRKIPNPDPIDLTVTIGAEEKVQTGMIHAELVNTTRSGYVRLNGRTLGNATSGGTERANADTEALFTYLWNNLTDAIAPVSGGRGASGAADFAANKVITLPNFQGAIPIGLDDMGGAAGNWFSGLTFGAGNATTPGSSLGANSLTLTQAQMPAHTHAGTTAAEGAHTHSGTTAAEAQTHTHSGTTSSDGDHSHTINVTDPGHNHNVKYNAIAVTRNTLDVTVVQDISSGGSQTGTNAAISDTTGITASSVSTGAHTHNMTTGNNSGTHTHAFTSGAGTAHSHTFTTDSQGSNAAINNLGRSVLVTWFIKL